MTAETRLRPGPRHLAGSQFLAGEAFTAKVAGQGGDNVMVMRNLIRTGAVITGAMALAGCLNMPTPENQITGAYVSGLNYEQFDCAKLLAELDSLNRRESDLVGAQKQRIKTSQTQAFWYGVGQGDGIEATELSHVRGEREAVRKSMAAKSCPAP